jgi:hypothetical protein
MTPALPYGAREIALARANGKRPADMLLVSLIGPLSGERNPVVLARPERSYDWRWAAGLEILVVADSITDQPRVKRILEALKRLTPSPDYLGLWLADKQAGTHVCWGNYAPRSARVFGFYEQRIYEGLGKSCN